MAIQSTPVHAVSIHENEQYKLIVNFSDGRKEAVKTFLELIENNPNHHAQDQRIQILFNEVLDLLIAGKAKKDEESSKQPLLKQAGLLALRDLPFVARATALASGSKDYTDYSNRDKYSTFIEQAKRISRSIPVLSQVAAAAASSSPEPVAEQATVGGITRFIEHPETPSNPSVLAGGITSFIAFREVPGNPSAAAAAAASSSREPVALQEDVFGMVINEYPATAVCTSAEPPARKEVATAPPPPPRPLSDGQKAATTWDDLESLFES